MLFQFTANMDFGLKKGIRCVGDAMFMFTALVIFYMEVLAFDLILINFSMCLFLKPFGVCKVNKQATQGVK